LIKRRRDSSKLKDKCVKNRETKEVNGKEVLFEEENEEKLN
jgi:hypothetical protein